MRPRLALAAAGLFASAAVSIPAHAAATSAAVLPYCATTLHNAAAGVSSSCATQGPPPVECSSCGVRRTVDIVVAKGSVDATLLCDGYPTSTHVDGPGTGTIGVWGGLNCTTTLTSTADGTTAAATSTASYVIISE
jgi:hypothetical protein